VLDGRATLDPRVEGFPAAPGDRLLLCSDGLSDAIDDAQITRVLAIADRDVCAHALIEQALAAGGRDNITVVVADVVDDDDAQAGWLPAL
jgi:PPM family protein phosphatase